MKRWTCPLLMWLLLATGGFVPALGEDEHLPPMPARLKPFEAFLQLCEKYNQQTRDTRWVTICDERFDDPAKASWSVVPDASRPGTANLVEHEHRRVLRAESSGPGSAYIKVGPTTPSPFAVEMWAMPAPDRPGSLSIFTGMGGQGPGFELLTGKAGDKSGDKLRGKAGDKTPVDVQIWTNWPGEGKPPQDGFKPVPIALEQPLPADKFSKVRMEVHEGWITLFVEGKQLARVSVGEKFKAEGPWQPMVYVYDSAVLIERLRTQVPRSMATPATSPATIKTLTVIFGDDAQARVSKQAGQLVKLLDDDDWATREWAQKGLIRAGVLALNELKEALAQGSAEQKQRCRAILAAVGASESLGP